MKSGNQAIRLEQSQQINKAYRNIDPEKDWNYEGTTSTVKEYMEKHPLALHKEHDSDMER